MHIKYLNEREAINIKRTLQVLMTGWTGLATLEKQGGNHELPMPKRGKNIGIRKKKTGIQGNNYNNRHQY